MERPTYVLVHGAWCGAWCWRDLGVELDRRSVAWRTIDLPSSHDESGGTATLRTDAARVATSAAQDGPVVLVGHSYGGAVVSEAAGRVANVVGAVYLAALVPNVGESATDASRLLRVRTELDDAIEVDAPFLRLDPELAGSALFQECSPQDQSWAVDQLGRQTIVSFRSARRSPDSLVPRRYVLCRHDHAIDPSLQELMAKRCDDVVELSSDHSPFLSHVVECADAVLAAPTRAF